MNPKISVIIPIYNVEKYLDKCLNSVMNQTLKDIEIICVDDCSPDGSHLIVEKYAAEDSRISFIRHEENLGLGGARNTAIRAAKADFIASVDSDDYIEPTMLEILWDATEEGKFDIICCGFDRVDNNGKQVLSQEYPNAIIENKNNSINIFTRMNPAFWNKLWRKSLYTQNDIFFPNHLFYEDMATTPRILAKAKRMKIINSGCLYHYLVRSNSITSTYGPRHMIDYFKVFEILLSFLIKNNLAERYENVFFEFIEKNISYHAKMVSEANLSELDLEQYLKHFLLLKLGFFNYFDLLKDKKEKELISILGSATCTADLI